MATPRVLFEGGREDCFLAPHSSLSISERAIDRVRQSFPVMDDSDKQVKVTCVSGCKLRPRTTEMTVPALYGSSHPIISNRNWRFRRS